MIAVNAWRYLMYSKRVKSGLKQVDSVYKEYTIVYNHRIINIQQHKYDGVLIGRGILDETFIQNKPLKYQY